MKTPYRDRIDTVQIGETQLTWVPPKTGHLRNPEPSIIISHKDGVAVDVSGIQDIIKFQIKLTQMIKQFGAGESG